MLEWSPLDDRHRARARQRALGMVYFIRALYLALGGIMVLAALFPLSAHWATSLFVALTAFVWPHIARAIVQRHADPRRADLRCAAVDAMVAGAWIALIGFNLLPSALLLTMIGSSSLVLGGPRQLAVSLGCLLLACLLAGLVTGFAFALHTSALVVLACLPALVISPLAMAGIIQTLMWRVRSQTQELRRLSSVDTVSGLYNRGYWEAGLHDELSRPGAGPSVLMMVDVDHFKRVNDEFGHPVGDAVLARLGEVIRAHLRPAQAGNPGDLAGRYGGDEFGVLLHGLDVPAARAVAERIRAQMSATHFAAMPDRPCTLSVGLAARGPDVGSAQDWLEQADAALYAAKQAGRDCLKVAGPRAASA